MFTRHKETKRDEIDKKTVSYLEHGEWGRWSETVKHLTIDTPVGILFNAIVALNQLIDQFILGEVDRHVHLDPIQMTDQISDMWCDVEQAKMFKLRTMGDDKCTNNTG